MENKLISDRKRIKQLSENLDSLINKATGRGLPDPDIENQIKELIDLIKALDNAAQPCGIDTGGNERG